MLKTIRKITSLLRELKLHVKGIKKVEGITTDIFFCYESRVFAIASVLRANTFLCRTDIEDFSHFEEIFQISPFLFVISVFIELKEY